MEFSGLQQVSTALNSAAIQGQKFTDPATNAAETAKLQQTIDFTSSANTNFNLIFDKSRDYIKKARDNKQGINIGAIVVGSFLVVACIVIIVFTICLRQGRFPYCRYLTKIVLLVSSVLVFLLCIVSIGLFVVALVTGTSCEGVKTMLTTTDYSNITATFNITDASITNIFTTCVASTGSGKFIDSLTTADMKANFDNLQTFIQGFNNSPAQKAYMDGPTDSKTIDSTVSVWQ